MRDEIVLSDERVTEENKKQRFNDDLSISLSDVRACLDHWGLKDWREYLIVRKPGKPESYIIMANPKDASGFDERLLELHQQIAATEQS